MRAMHSGCQSTGPEIRAFDSPVSMRVPSGCRGGHKRLASPHAAPLSRRAGRGWPTHSEAMNSRTPPGPPEGPLQRRDRDERIWSGPRPAASRRSFLTHAGVALVALFVGVLIGVTGNSSADKAAPSAAVTTTATTTHTAAAGKHPSADKVLADGIPGDGTYVVGSDIKPGTYRSEGPQGGLVTDCYWARLSSTSGEAKDIIANANTGGQTTVTIAATDKAFTTTGCKAWKKTG
ncbi:twin-arginine translocation signal domain-containing protein [Streptomyces sp. NPDC047042]|uniref:twin-arginine translocation signal domain-containing protein n=1 Tax=Streptomyces sp. NPDC047042 TaxID=3154807 RepID=UPI0033F432C4